MSQICSARIMMFVALLAEGVDRNSKDFFRQPQLPASPSSRRAWIEIYRPCLFGTLCYVALLAEGVDRNNIKTVDLPVTKGSPSSRRAWIEIVI